MYTLIDNFMYVHRTDDRTQDRTDDKTENSVNDRTENMPDDRAGQITGHSIG